MQTVILAGGLGSRLGELTEAIPKPMITVGDKPIIWHIMNRFSMFGYNNFSLALGYKSEIIKDYFLNYKTLNSDFVYRGTHMESLSRMEKHVVLSHVTYSQFCRRARESPSIFRMDMTLEGRTKRT